MVKKRIYNVFGKRIVNQMKQKNKLFLNPLKFILYQLSIFCIIVALWILLQNQIP